MNRRLLLPTLPAALIAGAVLALSACTPTRPADVPLDQRFGTRVADDDEVLTITPLPDSSHFVYPALVSEVIFRPAPFSAPGTPGAGAVPVEVLVKGVLPDACSELHAAPQDRMGHIVTMELLSRRPQGVVCAQVVRPFRFYAILEGTYAPGSYTLKLNGGARPFEVRAPRFAQPPEGTSDGSGR